MPETRNLTRHPEECRKAIVSLAKFWRRLGRDFTVTQISHSVFGYHGGDVSRFIQDALESGGVPFKMSNAGRKKGFRVKPTVTHVAKLEPAPKPRPVCTHFVVTTDMHV